ncbi:MAG: hypothetical protein KDD62_02955 [Bdellovibrionales bacterium]|nr:hypothetical protein [Bdellovibrionales bacterium]
MNSHKSLALIVALLLSVTPLLHAENVSFARFSAVGGNELIDLQESHGKTYNKASFETYFELLHWYHIETKKKLKASSENLGVPTPSNAVPAQRGRNAWEPARYFHTRANRSKARGDREPQRKDGNAFHGEVGRALEFLQSMNGGEIAGF